MAVCSVLTFGWLQPANAQSVVPSQLVPPTFRNSAPVQSGRTIESGDQSLRGGFPHLTVSINRIIVEGGFGELEGETTALVNGYEGRRLAVSEIYQLAAAIERMYADRGYVLVRVGVPPQELSDGATLRIAILEGFIEAVDFMGVPEGVRHAVLVRTRGLIGVKRVTLAQIERDVLLAGEIPGLRLRSALARGDQPGGVKLVLDGDHDRLSGTIGIDNRIPSSLGCIRFSGWGSANNVLKLGEQIYVSLGTSDSWTSPFDDRVPLAIGSVGAVIPLGNDGLTLNPEYSKSKTFTPSLHGAAATAGVYDRIAARLSYPFLLTRNYALYGTGGVERIDQQADAADFQTAINHDAYWALRGGFNGRTQLIDRRMSLDGGITLSRGVAGRNSDDAATSGVPLSRTGASPEFTKLGANVTVSVPVAERFRVDAFVSGQSSFGAPLLKPEQFALDGTQSLSAFQPGALSVDSGLSARLELVVPQSFDVSGRRLQLEPYAYAGAGWGRVEQPTSLEAGTISARAYGAGLRLQTGSVGGGIEIGRGEATNVGEDWRVFASMKVGF